MAYIIVDRTNARDRIVQRSLYTKEAVTSSTAVLDGTAIEIDRQGARDRIVQRTLYTKEILGSLVPALIGTASLEERPEIKPLGSSGPVSTRPTSGLIYPRGEA